MKLFSKIAALAAVVLLVSGLAACKDAEEGPSVVAEYHTETNTELGVPATFTFYDDDSWELIYDFTSMGGNEELFYKGTYKGDPAKDGTITIIITDRVDYEAAVDGEKVKIEPIPEKKRTTLDITIKNGVLDLGDIAQLERVE